LERQPDGTRSKHIRFRGLFRGFAAVFGLKNAGGFEFVEVLHDKFGDVEFEKSKCLVNTPRSISKRRHSQQHENVRVFLCMRRSSLFVAILLFAAFQPTRTFARFLWSVSLNDLMEKSALVFVGEIQTVKPSGITTELTYPEWTGAVFEWLDLKVQVREAVKGASKDNVVDVLVLSTQSKLGNAPGFIFPKKGQRYLFCLLPTTVTNKYAAFTAPFDENKSIFTEDRTYWEYPRLDNPNNRSAYATLKKYMDKDRGFTAESIARLRKAYKKEIETPTPANAVIHLKWKTHTNASGWQSNVPDDAAESKLAPLEQPH
jgi:hypothetical protein